MVRRLPIACLSASMLLVACGDPASLDPQLAASKKYDQTLANARKVLAEAAVADAAASRTTADALRAAAGACTAPNGATEGQKAAFALTSAQLLREAARLDIHSIEKMQAQQRAFADQLVSALQQGKALRELQGAMPSSDDEQAAAIQKAIDASTALASEAESQAQTERGTIEAKQAEAKENSDKAADLEAQAAKKRTAAAAARTATEAQSLTQEAAALTTQAIEARRVAGAAEIVVRNLTPDAERQQRQSEGLRAQIARLQADLQALEAAGASRGKANTALSSASRAALDKARTAAESLEKISGEVKAAMTSTAESLESAASNAQRGGSTPGSQGARMTAASANLAQAMLQERWAGGASMEAYAFDAMAKASGDAKWSKLASGAREDATAATAKALTALEAADAALGSDTSASLTSLRSRIAEARKMMEGPKKATSEGAPAGEGQPATDAATETPAENSGDASTSEPKAEPAPEPAQPAAEPAPGR